MQTALCEKKKKKKSLKIWYPYDSSWFYMNTEAYKETIVSVRHLLIRALITDDYLLLFHNNLIV